MQFTRLRFICHLTEERGSCSERWLKNIHNVWVVSFIWGKMRTVAWETASRLALTNCSKKLEGEGQYMWLWWRESSHNLAFTFCRMNASHEELLAQMVRNLPVMQETWGQSLGWEGLLEKSIAVTHSSTLAWEIPWTGEPGRLQFMGSKNSCTGLSR